MFPICSHKRTISRVLIVPPFIFNGMREADSPLSHDLALESNVIKVLAEPVLHLKYAVKYSVA